MKISLLSRLCGIALPVLFAAATLAAPPNPPRYEFNRMVAHWAEYGDPGYLSFINDAQPQVAQIGFYGAHFWSVSHTPAGKGYPAHFPVMGLKECGQWFEDMNQELHKRNVKVVGHFNVKFLIGDIDGPEGPRGFFKFYRDLWDESELGPKPVADPVQLLERDASGAPIGSHKYAVGKMAEYWGCLVNPHWRTVLKAWAKRGIERGVDGYMINYFYRHDCHCEHCQRAFREHLTQNFSPAELKSRFEIADLAHHKFTEIVAWHKPDESTPLRREMLKFSQLANKRAFDEVFLDYARSLKPDLLVGQWDHLSDFSQISGDERCMLPSKVWGRGEDYLWYSTGASACYTDLAAGHLGEGTLQARYIRGSFDDKPFTLGKYEGTRIRAAIAELAANGGAPMGFYTRFKDPAAREEIVRYYQFLKRYDELYHANRSHAEVVLLYPRSRVQQAADIPSVTAFKQLGKQLLSAHVLFDVRPDDAITLDQRAAYRHVVSVADGTPDIASWSDLSKFEGPATVRVSVSRPEQGNELTVHLVNYNREEPAQAKSPGRGIADEKPLAVDSFKCQLRLPEGAKVLEVVAMTPESPEPVKLEAKVADAQVSFAAPKFLVYQVIRIRLAK